MKTPYRATLLAVLAGTLALASCSGPAAPGPDPSNPSGPSAKTFTLALSADPGALDPQMSVGSHLYWASAFAYDPLINMDKAGKITSGLASEWSQDGDEITLKIKDGVTCSDGAEFKASTAAANITFVSNPENASPLLGAFLPAGIEATADDATKTLTLKLTQPAPFALSTLSNLFMVCDAGLADRSTLAAATNGTGPFVLKEAVPNDHYSYTLREGYAWGPDGATNVLPGAPSAVELRVIADETTAANMLLGKELNAAMVIGPDAQRLAAANLFSVDALMVLGEQWANEAADHVTSDPVIRKALVQAVDLAELRSVITSGTGVPATSFETSDPVPCPGDSVTANLPAFDKTAAGAALDQAGWKAGANGVRTKDGKPLTITFLHDTALGSGGAAAAELATAAWKELGIDVQAQGLPTDQMQGILFGSGAWDVAWEPVNLSSPDQITGLVSGAGVAEGGMNFGNISNPAYEEKVAQASKINGQDGCATWLAADAELVKAVDVIPFASNPIKLFGSGAEFDRVGYIIPATIRMTE
ncbi:MAG: ABC transporter substrate-binding protein [Propionibacteriaceae bacterium]|jgi:peptide/nickel transport system substrate-binding protein|nr:ABC transporter substrate-binding protein [Propionibacteriaceae bacterium]